MEALVPASAVLPVAADPAASAAEPSPEITAVITNLHWLVHQGHVIEFANGILETARKPLPKPPKPEKKPEAAPSGAHHEPAPIEFSAAPDQKVAENEPAALAPASEETGEAVRDLSAGQTASETGDQKPVESAEEKPTPDGNTTA